ncbi:MAG TPA: ribonuclease PH, partial [Deltaproteobacteria bacterium]|nr:ribonuclease PH [Deltaproteobacteria bacterium]
MLQRSAGRKHNELRPINITNNFLKTTAGSALVEFGNTKVICAATLEDKPAPFLKNTGRGWVTAEYSMLPASTHTRTARESTRGKIGGRTHEIQRLIGRSLRAVCDLNSFGEKTIYVDCDVI